MGVRILLFLLIYFGLAFFFAHEFYVVACDKGYNSSKYYWICFWFGIVGYLLVIALPTKPQQIVPVPKEVPEMSEESFDWEALENSISKE